MKVHENTQVSLNFSFKINSGDFPFLQNKSGKAVLLLYKILVDLGIVCFSKR